MIGVHCNLKDSFFIVKLKHVVLLVVLYTSPGDRSGTVLTRTSLNEQNSVSIISNVCVYVKPPFFLMELFVQQKLMGMISSKLATTVMAALLKTSGRTLNLLMFHGHIKLREYLVLCSGLVWTTAAHFLSRLLH